MPLPIIVFQDTQSSIRSRATGALGDAAKSDGVISVDVSDLGLTMADLDKKIPIHDFR